MAPDWGLLNANVHSLFVQNKLIIGEIWPRFLRVCEKLDVSYAYGVEGGELPPDLGKGLSQKHLNGIGCGHYRYRKEKTFPGQILQQ